MPNHLLQKSASLLTALAILAGVCLVLPPSVSAQQAVAPPRAASTPAAVDRNGNAAPAPADTATTDQQISSLVKNLIARRQSSVQPGEPPYRPQVRFQVSREGLRTYYHVYPLIEPLRLPMTRENLED